MAQAITSAKFGWVTARMLHYAKIRTLAAPLVYRNLPDSVIGAFPDVPQHPPSGVELPDDTPYLTLVNRKVGTHLLVEKNRIDFAWNSPGGPVPVRPTPPEDGMRALADIQKQMGYTIDRLGYSCAFVADHEQPAVFLRDRFCSEKWKSAGAKIAGFEVRFLENRTVDKKWEMFVMAQINQSVAKGSNKQVIYFFSDMAITATSSSGEGIGSIEAAEGLMAAHEVSIKNLRTYFD